MPLIKARKIKIKSKSKSSFRVTFQFRILENFVGSPTHKFFVGKKLSSSPKKVHF